MHIKTGSIKMAVVIIALAVLVFTLYFFFRTEYVVLYSGINENKIISFKESLEAEGIKTRTGMKDATLEVDSERIVDAKIICTNIALDDEVIAFSDALTSLRLNNKSEVNNKISVKAHEEKLAAELSRLEGIKAADVVLTVPALSRLFIHDKDDAKVSAMINISRELTPRETDFLTNYFMASVEGLKMENISITDQEYRVIF